MIQANIANFVRQEVRVPKTKPLLPVFEAVSNALDAIADRKGTGTVRVTVRRNRVLLDSGRGSPYSFTIEDDGIGFNAENIAAFDELYSIRKIRQGGKGRGRFTFLKVFQRAEIHSTFEESGALKRRDFVFDTTYFGYKEPPVKSHDPVGTKIILSGMRQEFADKVPREAVTLAKDFISHFLPLLLSDRPIEIIIDDEEDVIHLARLVRTDLLIDSHHEKFQIGSRAFSVRCVKLRPKLINLRHRLILAAAAREVSGYNLDKAIAVLTTGPLALEGEPDGFFFVAIVEGAFLDEAVDPMRITFTDEDDAATDDDETMEEELLVSPNNLFGDLFGEPQSIGQVRREAIKIVRQQLDPYIKAAIEHRAEAIEKYIRRDGMGYHFLKGEIPELAKNLKSTDDRTIESSLHAAAYIERRKRSAQAHELLSVNPKEKSEDTYFKKWTDIVESLGDVAKSDLANYVAHRRVIIDLVEDKLRTTPKGGYSREEVLHSIVFPRGKQTGEVGYEQQNLWLIDERLAFHEHLYSDLTIRRITGNDVDSAERPDLAIYESGFASFYDGARPPAQLVLVS
jgi:hypothetical protein